jgi:hypothetical protein
VSDEWEGSPEEGDKKPWLDYEVEFQGDAIARLNNDELHLSTLEEPLIEKVENLFQNALARSRCISLHEWQHRGLWERFVARCSLLFYWEL